MVLYMDVLDLQMPDVVICQVAGGIIVTVKWGWVMLGEADAIQKLVKEQCFMRGIVESDVFGII